MEFAFVFPILVVASVGALELAMIIFDFHTASEATRRGVRTAIIEQPLATLGSIGSGISCVTSGVSNVSCSGGTVTDKQIFDRILADMQQIMPQLTRNDITITYTDSGVFNVGGVVRPLVSISLQNLQHDFVIVNLLPGLPSSITYPSFETTRMGQSCTVGGNC